MFEIEAGCSKNFTEDLYSSMNSFLDGNITLEEFLDELEEDNFDDLPEDTGNDEN